MDEQHTKEYEYLWRNKWLTATATTITEMAEMLEQAAKELREMSAAGVTLDDNGGQGDDYARLITTDAVVAERFSMEALDDEEFDDDDDDDDDD